MDIKLLKQYIANKSPKKTITESVDYVVVRTETIPYEETHTGIAGTTKTIKNPKGGMVVVLLKFLGGWTTTGVGKTKAEAIRDAVASKKALFGESTEHVTEELTVVKNHDGGYVAFNGNPAKNAPVVAFISKTGEILKVNKQGAPTKVKTATADELKSPEKLKKAISSILTESSVPNAVRKYLETPYSQHTYGTAYDAGSAVANHPAVREYHAHVSATMRSKSNAEVVKAYHSIPKDVLDRVAKDFGTTAYEVASMYRSYTQD